jgi:hypothetical protein
MSNILPWVASILPIVGGIVAAIVVTQFLLALGRWESSVPWPVRAFSRVFVLVVFVYLLLIGIGGILPEGSAIKLGMVRDGLTLTGDILKTVIGAIIGALSVALKQKEEEDRRQNEKTPPVIVGPDESVILERVLTQLRERETETEPAPKTTRKK